MLFIVFALGMKRFFFVNFIEQLRQAGTLRRHHYYTWWKISSIQKYSEPNLMEITQWIYYYFFSSFDWNDDIAYWNSEMCELRTNPWSCKYWERKSEQKKKTTNSGMYSFKTCNNMNEILKCDILNMICVTSQSIEFISLWESFVLQINTKQYSI